MMNKGKIIAILTALAMTICINPVLASAQDVTASSASKNEYDMAFSSEDMEITDKMIFAERMHQKHEAARVKGETTEKSTEEIYHLMEQISFARLNSDEKTAKEYETELEKCGVYVYTRGEIIIPAQNQEDAVAPASIWYPDSSASDVIMNAPSIYHNVNDDNWIISCGGSWRNDNWCPYIPETTGYLGEADAFGVGYTSAKTPYSSSVVSSYASIVDQRNQYITSTQYRSDGDGSKGF